MAGHNRAGIVRARRKVAAAMFLADGYDALTARQVGLLLDIEQVSRANYAISDQQWFEIETRRQQSKAQLDG